MAELIDLKGMNKAEVLAKLYNAAVPPGSLGVRALTMAVDRAPMTVQRAQEILDTGQTYFDYIGGCVLKVDLSGDTLNPWLYDRDNGFGAAARAIGLTTPA